MTASDLCPSRKKALGFAGHFAHAFLDLTFGLLDGALDSIHIHVVLSLLDLAIVTITVEHLRSFRSFGDMALLFLSDIALRYMKDPGWSALGLGD